MGDIYKNWASDEFKSSFLGSLIKIRAKEGPQDGVPLLTFPGSNSLTPRCVGNLKPIPQAEAPG